MYFSEEKSEEFENDYSSVHNSMEVPAMPILLKEGETEPSDVFQRVQQTAYPPIFAKNTWTKGVLYKDVQKFYTPSECIGM